MKIVLQSDTFLRKVRFVNEASRILIDICFSSFVLLQSYETRKEELMK